LVGLL